MMIMMVHSGGILLLSQLVASIDANRLEFKQHHQAAQELILNMPQANGIARLIDVLEAAACWRLWLRWQWLW